MNKEINVSIRTEETLQRELAFRKSIEKAIPSGICVSDMTGRLIYANHTFCKMFEFKQDELLNNSPPYMFWPKDEHEQRKIRFFEFLNENRIDKDEVCRFCRKNGEIIWGLNSNVFLKDPEGQNIGAIISIYDITKRKQAEDELIRSRIAIRKLAAKVIDSQEKERKRIAKELHDSIGSSITGVRYAVERKLYEMGESECQKDVCLEDILEMLQKISRETRRISKNLHPEILDHMGIKVALQSHCKQFIKIYTNMDIECQIEINEEKLNDNLKLLIFRIVQEALNNAAKHSQADRLQVSLTGNHEKISLSIKDNGTGFEPAKPDNENTDNENMDNENTDNSSMGLESMKERAEYSGGSFKIESSPGNGTCISVIWPVKPVPL